METYVVVHKNPQNRSTQGGKAWAVDGLDEEWTEAQCALHAKRCAYVGAGIEFAIVASSDVGNYVALPKKKTRTTGKKKGAAAAKEIS